MSKILGKIRGIRMGGILIGVAVDLLVLLLIPGSSIIEGILAFIAGISAGVAWMRTQRVANAT